MFVNCFINILNSYFSSSFLSSSEVFESERNVENIQIPEEQGSSSMEISHVHTACTSTDACNTESPVSKINRLMQENNLVIQQLNSEDSESKWVYFKSNS